MTPSHGDWLRCFCFIQDDNEVELPPEVMKRLYQLKALQSEKDVVRARAAWVVVYPGAYNFVAVFAMHTYAL